MRQFLHFPQTARGITGVVLKYEPILSSCNVSCAFNRNRLISSLSSPPSPPKLSSTNETVVEKFDPLKKISPCIKLDPRAVFPWRHSAYPLPRLLPDTQEFITEGGYIGPNLPPMNMFLRGLVWVNACGFLGAKVTNYTKWKKEMENAFQHAFAVGVHGVLNDIYHENVEENDSHDNTLVNDEEETFPIDFNHFVKPEDDYHLKKAEEEGAGSDMIEPSLISLYRSARTSGKHKLEIILKSRPKSAEIMSFFVVPFLTRREVKDNISLKHSFRNIVKALHQMEREKGRELSYFEMGDIVAEMLDDMSLEQMQRRGDETVQITIVAQVAVQCDELFVVRDSETGDVVQGDPDEKVNDVTHLVRFETVLDMNRDKEIQLGSWQITDWDDLIDGNIWFF